MELKIEITEDEIRSAIERKVRTAIADQTNNYRTNDYIKEQVRQQWQSAVQSLVAEALKDSPALREKIACELGKKLRAQLSAAIVEWTDGTVEMVRADRIKFLKELPSEILHIGV